MSHRRKLVRTGATLIVLVAALASLPAMLQRLSGAAAGAAGSASDFAGTLGFDPAGAGQAPTIIASGGRALTSAQRRALLEQAIANAPIPLSDDPAAMSERDRSAAALQHRLRTALARVEGDGH